MSLKSRAAFVAIILCVIFSIGCGDTFRPIAIPIIQNGGQPQANRQAVVLSTAGAGVEGATTHVDVSGDTNVGQVAVGRDPINVAIIGNGTLVVVVNRGDESITAYSMFGVANSQTPTFVSLPAGSVPKLAYSNVAGAVFVTETGVNKVGVVSLTGSPTALVKEIPVGIDPEGLVGTPDGTRLFVANKGDGTVDVIDTGTNALLVGSLPSTITVGAGPSYLAVNATGTRIFSVNTTGNSVSVIDTTTDTAAAPVPVGTAPNFAYFDAANGKLWVTNPGSDSVSVINVDPHSSPPFSATTIQLPAGCAPQSITVLADGSRAYVAGTGCGSVSVINTLSNTITKTIAVGTNPVSIVSSPDNTKVITANKGSANISIIRTSDDTVVNTLAAPNGMSPVMAAISPF